MTRSNPFGNELSPRRSHKGFSLQEMLVVVSIIIVLVALITPTLTAIQEIRRRAVCSTNNKAFATLCLQYAMAQGAISRDPRDRLNLPSGRVDDPEDLEDSDNYLLMADSSFQELTNKYGLQKEQAMCASMPPTLAPDSVETPLFDVGAGMASGTATVPAIYMGLIYWAGRDHIWEMPVDDGSGDPPEPPDARDDPLFYSFRTKDLHKDVYPESDNGTPDDPSDDLEEEWYEYTPSSNMLVSCMMFDVNANASGADLDSNGDGQKDVVDCPENVSVMPHSSRRFRTFEAGEEPELSTGVVIGYTDGAAKWVETEELTPIDQFQRLWYDPQ